MDNQKSPLNTEKTLTQLEIAIKKGKRKLWISRLVILGISLIFMFILPEVAGIGFLIFLFYMIMGPFWIKELKRGYCTNCGSKFDYQNDIEWEVVEEISEENSVKALVEFSCNCANCGSTQTFTKKFTVASYNSQKQNWTRHNLDTLCRKYLNPKL